MISRIVTCLVSLTCLCYAYESAAQESVKPNFQFASPELFVAGPQFLTGAISEKLATGVEFNAIELGITTLKNPEWTFGFSWMDFGASHKFSPTPAESSIISNYEIITTTTETDGTTTTSREPLDEIILIFYRIGIFTEYQPIIQKQQKLSPFLRVTLSANRAYNNLPADDQGTIDRDKSKWGAGINLKAGTDFRLNGAYSIRLGYSLGLISDFDMNLIEGVMLEGGGFSHSVYIGVGFNSFYRNRN